MFQLDANLAHILRAVMGLYLAFGLFWVWSEPFTHLRVPLITYYDWLLDHAFMLVPTQSYVAKFVATFKDFPPRQNAVSFSIDQALEKMQRLSGD